MAHVEFPCPECSHLIRAPDEHAGGRGICSACRTEVDVPPAPDDAPRETPEAAETRADGGPEAEGTLAPGPPKRGRLGVRLGVAAWLIQLLTMAVMYRVVNDLVARHGLQGVRENVDPNIFLWLVGAQCGLGLVALGCAVSAVVLGIRGLSGGERPATNVVALVLGLGYTMLACLACCAGGGL